MRKAMAFVIGAVMGGVIGALSALLLTPYSGKELKTALQNEVDKISAEIKDAAIQKRAELENQLEEMIKSPETT